MRDASVVDGREDVEEDGVTNADDLNRNIVNIDDFEVAKDIDNDAAFDGDTGGDADGDDIGDKYDKDENPDVVENTDDPIRKQPSKRKASSIPSLLSNELYFPSARVKKVLKLDPSVKQLGADAVKLMNKAAELFVNRFVNKILINKRHKKKNKKTIVYDDLWDVYKADSSLGKYKFLEDILKATKPAGAISFSASNSVVDKNKNKNSDNTNQQVLLDPRQKTLNFKNIHK